MVTMNTLHCYHKYGNDVHPYIVTFGNYDHGLVDLICFYPQLMVNKCWGQKKLGTKNFGGEKITF